VGWSVPSGAIVLSSALNIQKALSGGSGADHVALVDTTGAPRLFLETVDLAKNTKDSAAYAPLSLGTDDALFIAAMDGVGSAGGTVSGSNDSDVRVMLRLRFPDTLPNA
jgi:hypothetical protein